MNRGGSLAKTTLKVGLRAFLSFSAAFLTPEGSRLDGADNTIHSAISRRRYWIRACSRCGRKVSFKKWPYKQLGRPGLDLAFLVQLQSMFSLVNILMIAHCQHIVDVPNSQTTWNSRLADHTDAC